LGKSQRLFTDTEKRPRKKKQGNGKAMATIVKEQVRGPDGKEKQEYMRRGGKKVTRSYHGWNLKERKK